MQEYLNSVYNSPYGEMKQKLIDNNYICIIYNIHCLYDDELWVHPDTLEAQVTGKRNPKWIFVFKDKPLSSQSSTQTMRRYRKLNKWQTQIILTHYKNTYKNLTR